MSYENTNVNFPQGGVSMEVASGGEINVQSGGALNLLAGSTFTFAPGTWDATGGASLVSLKDNTAGAFEVKEGANSYLKLDTTNGSELVTITPAVNVVGAFTVNGAKFAVNAANGNVTLADGAVIAPAANVTGLKIGSAVTDKIGFYGVAPIVCAVLATGTGKTSDNIITAMQNLGLVKQA